MKLGEKKCPKCKGMGYTSEVNDVFTTCDKCWGHGKLDWIEMVIGKRMNSCVFHLSVKLVQPIEFIKFTFKITKDGIKFKDEKG